MIVNRNQSLFLGMKGAGATTSARYRPLVPRSSPVAHARPKPRNPNQKNGGDEEGAEVPDYVETIEVKSEEDSSSSETPAFFQTPMAPKFNFKRVEDSSEWKSSDDESRSQDAKAEKSAQQKPGDRFRARFNPGSDKEETQAEVIDPSGNQDANPPPFFNTPLPPKFVFKRVEASEGDLAEVSGSESIPGSKEMSLADAALILGTERTASFDEILKQKNNLIKTASPEQSQKIEDAYDVLFAASLKRRLSGQSDVIVSGIRSKDPTPKQNWPSKRDGSSKRGGGGTALMDRPGSNPLSNLPKGLPSLGNSLPVAFASPRNQTLALQQTALFSGLIVWAALQASFESPQAQMADTAGFQLAIALTYAVYSLRENKGIDLGKAIGIGLASLFIGAIIGNGVQSWLRVDLIPIGSFQSPGVLCSCFALVGMLISTLIVI